MTRNSQSLSRAATLVCSSQRKRPKFRRARRARPPPRDRGSDRALRPGEAVAAPSRQRAWQGSRPAGPPAAAPGPRLLQARPRRQCLRCRRPRRPRRPGRATCCAGCVRSHGRGPRRRSTKRRHLPRPQSERKRPSRARCWPRRRPATSCERCGGRPTASRSGWRQTAGQREAARPGAGQARPTHGCDRRGAWRPPGAAGSAGAGAGRSQGARRRPSPRPARRQGRPPSWPPPRPAGPERTAAACCLGAAQAYSRQG
mmetsp:Transcript_18273/g.69181  ORF Transcript_18273/g.69181 Transcript_18273/m.69181 type:complete len:257 (-) Transcript_18273:1254-2024(-)